MDDSVGCDIVLIKGPSGFVQPNILFRPPHCMIWPVHGNIWKSKQSFTLNSGSVEEWWRRRSCIPRVGGSSPTAGDFSLQQWYCCPSKSALDYSKNIINITTLTFCQKYLCSKKHKFTFRIGYFWTCVFLYITIFCKKLKYGIKPNFSNDWIRPTHVIFWKKIQRLGQVIFYVQMDRAIIFELFWVLTLVCM